MVRHILVFYFKLIIQCIVLLKVLFSNIQYCCHDTLVTSKMAGWLHVSITMHKKANEQNGISADSLLPFLIWPLYCLSLFELRVFGYPIGILWSLYCLSLSELHLLIIHFVSLEAVLLYLHYAIMTRNAEEEAMWKQ